jgi:hypothetical protein
MSSKTETLQEKIDALSVYPDHPIKPEEKRAAAEDTKFEELDYKKSWWKGYENQQELLERYVELTENLITSAQNFESVDGEQHPADIVVFLDKSARPLYWLMKDLWPLLAKPAEGAPAGQIPIMPQVRFVNIDRLPWRRDRSLSILEHSDNMAEPSAEDIQGLRAIFTRRPPKDSETISDVPTDLDGKRVLIVDEVNDSGDTIYVAKVLLSKAFPAAQFRTHAWMNRFKFGPSGEKQVLERPIWYSEKPKDGRVVFDPIRDKRISGKGVHSRVSSEDVTANQKPTLTPQSHNFLSTRPLIPRIPADEAEATEIQDQKQNIESELIHEDLSVAQRRRVEAVLKHLDFMTLDKKGLRLRREIGRLAGMIARHEILPYLTNYNGDFEAYKAARRGRVAIKNHKAGN